LDPVEAVETVFWLLHNYYNEQCEDLESEEDQVEFEES